VQADFRFAKVVILVGCLVVLGLNTAAQGLEKMSPNISHGFLELSLNNQIIKVTALGREYNFDARDTLNTIGDIRNRVERSGEHWKQRGSAYLRFWEERFQEILFYQSSNLEDKGFNLDFDLQTLVR
jgi:hypothetical protein